MLVLLAAAAGAGLVAPGRAGHGLVGGRAALLGLAVGVFFSLQAGLGSVQVDGAAALKTSGMTQICCRNFHKTLDFSLRIWYPI